MKNIETCYNNYKFRSRTEARWAVFFDHLKIRYEYEEEGFDLDGLWYLPDFTLPQFNSWLEVKPNHEGFFGSDDEVKVATLAKTSNRRVYVFFRCRLPNFIDDEDYGICYLPNGEKIDNVHVE